VVERILLVSEDGLISIEHLPREIVNAAIGHKTDSWENKSNSLPSGSPALTDRRTRKLAALEQEKEMIIQTLDMNAGNISKASAELGISRNTLYRKMKNYKIIN
jgi:transcriptional regulator of acetoin/glycerol metabolism